MHAITRSSQPCAHGLSHADLRRAIAPRVATAHAALSPALLCAMISGSTVEDLADARSDADMSIVFHRLPAEAELGAACRDAGGSAWFWQTGSQKAC